jgi:protein-L-isoaspartate(D-aspartate) O-methyltransferase
VPPLPRGFGQRAACGLQRFAEAFSTVPRHVFVPDVSVEDAYSDRWIATKRMPEGEVVSSSSPPEIMATMRF